MINCFKQLFLLKSTRLVSVIALNYFLFGHNFITYIANPENSNNIINAHSAKIIKVDNNQPQLKVKLNEDTLKLAFPGTIWSRNLRFAKIQKNELDNLIGKECDFELKKVWLHFHVDYSIRSMNCATVKYERSFFEREIAEKKLSSFIDAAIYLFAFFATTITGFIYIYLHEKGELS